MTDHLATLEQWANMADAASDGFDDGYAACLIELRVRVEALEANFKLTPNDPQIRSSLVERVAATLHGITNSDPNVPVNEWKPEARAAIREVNAWLRERAGGTRASWLLDNEIEQ